MADDGGKTYQNMEGSSPSETGGAKTVYWIRHAESEYNARKKEPMVWLLCKCCADPMIFDPRLSPKGQAQVRALKTRLDAEGFASKVQLVITSPLTRSLDTWKGLFEGAQVPCVVNPLIREILDTAGDIGRHPAELKEEFPALDFSKLEENWWHFDAKRGPRVPVDEPQKLFLARMEEFKKVLLARPEATIVVVGHSAFIKRITGSASKLPNCGVLETSLSPSGQLTKKT